MMRGVQRCLYVLVLALLCAIVSTTPVAPREVVFVSCSAIETAYALFRQRLPIVRIGFKSVALPCVGSGLQTTISSTSKRATTCLEQLRDARRRGALIVVPAHPRRLPNERLNVLVEEFGYNDDITDDMRRRQFQLQDKALLQQLLAELGFGHMTPRLFRSPDDVAASDFPVVVKRTFGTAGLGVYIVESMEKLSAMLANQTASFDNDSADHGSARHPFVIQQAVRGPDEWAAVYVRNALGFFAVRCHVYRKSSWSKSHLFIKGARDVRPTAVQQPCPAPIVELLNTTVNALRLESTGCINFKFDEKDRQYKVFDWNVFRQCGSLDPRLMVQLLTTTSLRV
eukprot:TRINITY_DN2220_c0_g1_i2.p1 TRINITY_DN2220_c0_g1~~TRINITY_DN2220_c0_g1_i2.p1  ORF type:complete len:341 (-),score=47.30 TRINITY_DN2220_c0_g1_i2:418-1440(-)